jgi:Na+-translocating ferredoxin:NAD+ oxidoreductase RnfG subunit
MNSSLTTKRSLALAFAAGMAPLVAYSQIYFTEDQAALAIFPGAKLIRKTIELTPAEIKQIEDRSGEKVHSPLVTVWVGAESNGPPNGHKEALFVDQVLGKHEFITFGLGIAKTGSVQGLEIMEYRETYGYDVRKPEWRKQFVGKDASSPLKLNKDITNLSGATLSSAHVTAGVRRLVRTYEVIRDRL